MDGFTNITSYPEQLFTRKSTAYYTILGVQVFASLILNSLFLLSLRKAHNCTLNPFFIMPSLSAADIMTSLNLCINGFVREFFIESFVTQEIMCKYGIYISSSNILCNALHVLYMALDRYVAIEFAFR